MSLFETLLSSLHNAPVHEVRVGASWTAVAVQNEDRLQCGLASTLGAHQHPHGEPAVADAGDLATKDALTLAALARSPRLMEASIGVAAVNALLPQQPAAWTDVNAGDLLMRAGAGKRVALVGHFPFVSRLREAAATLWVLELQPQPGDLPADAAAEVIPQADLVAVTGTTLINGTFDSLMALCRPNTQVMMLGPSTPLSPILFDFGVDLLAGSIVTDVDQVLRAVSQGANFRQVRRQGVRLVTMQRP